MIKTIPYARLNPMILHSAMSQFPIWIVIHVHLRVLIRIGLPDFSTSSLRYESLHSMCRERRFARRSTERFVSGKFTEWTVYTSTGLRMWSADVSASRTVSTPFVVCGKS